MEIQKNERKVSRILIVDDVITNLYILEEIIKSMGYMPKCASSAKEAMKMMEQELPELILLDIFMPEITGFEFCERLKKNPRTRDIPIIFISAATDREDKWRGFELGAVDFITKPFDVREVTMRVNTHLKMYQMQQEVENTNRQLHQVIKSQMKRIEEEQRNTLYVLAALADEDEEREGHLESVGHNSKVLAQGLQLSPDFNEPISENFIEMIELASMLHDIGKLRIADKERKNPLADNEEAVRLQHLHAEQGAQLLEKIHDMTYKNDFLAFAVDIARYHHARWDGIGEESGRIGKGIPLAARIVSVVDIFDVLTRECRNDMCEEESLNIIQRRAGTYYDPEIVHVFMKVRKQFWKS